MSLPPFSAEVFAQKVLGKLYKKAFFLLLLLLNSFCFV